MSPRVRQVIARRFTLIELLVVVAIISVLASMLLPALAQSRERVRVTVCLSNLKQIATGALMYEQDHEGMIPITTEGSQSFGPKMYAKHGITNPGLHMPDEFEYMAREYCGATEYNIPTSNPRPDHLGIFWCPSKEYKSELKVANQPYVAGGAVALTYSRNGQGYPLPGNVQDEGKKVYGGSWDTGPYRPGLASDASVWPIFFDEKIFTDDRYGVVDNHNRVLNAVYMDGSANTQLPDYGFRGNNYGQKNGSFVVWFLPYVRVGAMPW